MFHDILERKNAFQDYKNKKFKKSINLDFSKAVSPWFWSPNWQFFYLFISGKTGQEVCLRYFRRRKRLSYL